MQKTLLSAALVAAVAAFGFAPSAQAIDIGSGIITITGRVLADTCTVAVNGGAAVALPQVTTTSLATAGNVAGATNFDVGVSGCDTSIASTQMVFSGANRDATNGNLNNTAVGGSTAQVQLLSGASVINTQDQTNAPAIALTSGAGTTTLTAQYYANGAAATAGAVSTAVDFTLTYL